MFLPEFAIQENISRHFGHHIIGDRIPLAKARKESLLQRVPKCAYPIIFLKDPPRLAETKPTLSEVVGGGEE